MPTYEYSPDIAIASRFDARSWGANIDLYSRITIATGLEIVEGTASLAIIHDDALAFLNGRGIYRSWEDELNAGPLLGTFTTGIDEDDRVYIENATNDFEIIARPDNEAWGFAAAGTGFAGGIAPFRHTAYTNWPRGVMIIPSTGSSPTVAVHDGASTDYWPNDRGFTQDVPTSMRGRGVAGDIDDLGNDCLEILDDNAFTGHNTWGVDADGHVYNDTPYYKYPTEADATIVWIDTDLRDRLGFDGTEVIDSSTFYRWRTTATHPLPGFIKPTRPLIKLSIGTENVGSSIRKVSGAHYAAPINTYHTVDFSWHLDGPSDSLDLSRHWEEYVVPYLQEGMPFNLYQDWGDSRRAGLTRKNQTYGGTYTVEFKGYRGRLPLYILNGVDGTLEWPDELRRRMPINMASQRRD